MKRPAILIVDDDPATLDLLQFYLRSEGFDVAVAGTGTEALSLAENRRFDLSLTDLQLPDLDGIELVKRLKALSADLEIIMISGFGSVSQAVETTKAGAFYFVEKPVELAELRVLIDKAIERHEQSREIKELRTRLRDRASYYDLIGGSKPMQHVYELIDSVGDSEANILITGESGTGKELVANAVHFKSQRARKALMKVNCAALPKELIESELFGHTKGAFTGATADKVGLIAQAEGGSLFLDEIGEMPLDLQPKLLRVLQERTYSRLGNTRLYAADFRLIAATNWNPIEAIRQGHLREDLYYRINTIEIHLPPLRERAEDIQHLAEHFLREFAAKYDRPARSFSRELYQRFFEYSWPGNVRELRNTVERAVLLTRSDIISEAAFPFGAARRLLPKEQELPPVEDQMETRLLSPSGLTLDQLGKAIIEQAEELDQSQDLFSRLEEVIVRAAMERTSGNKQAAARLLGIYRPRLYQMIRKHQLQEYLPES